jgi:hypothetical protein
MQRKPQPSSHTPGGRRGWFGVAVSRLAAEERRQVVVDLILVGLGDAHKDRVGG